MTSYISLTLAQRKPSVTKYKNTTTSKFLETANNTSHAKQ